MECDFADVSCEVRNLYGLLQPHLPWLGFIFGAAMAIWRWWDGREAVLYRRATRRLEERGDELRAACESTLNLILRPSPGDPPRQPLFIVSSLREVLARRGWRPLFGFQDELAYADGKLLDTHEELAQKYKTVRQQKSFVVEQRFSTFMLQGAIEAARAGAAQSDPERKLRLSKALQFFDSALRVDGKGVDLLALELKGLQLVHLSRQEEAQQIFETVEELIARLLEGPITLDEDKRHAYELQRMRNARYRAQIHHKDGQNQPATGVLIPLVNNSNDLRWLSGQALLERAYFHEIHACVRVRIAMAAHAQNPAGGAAATSISAARTNYEDLANQLDPRHMGWLRRAIRWLLRMDWRDGSSELRARASDGLKRLELIQDGKGCPVCRDQTIELKT